MILYMLFQLVFETAYVIVKNVRYKKHGWGVSVFIFNEIIA